MSFQNLGRVRLHYAGLWSVTTTYKTLDYVYIITGTDPETQDLYISVVDDNIGNDPSIDTQQKYWVKISVSGKIPSSLRKFVATAKVADWSQIDTDTNFPYTHSNRVTLTGLNSEYVGLSLINDDCVLFGNYCFGMPANAVSGDQVTVYSIGIPTQDLTFTFTASLATN